MVPYGDETVQSIESDTRKLDLPEEKRKKKLSVGSASEYLSRGPVGGGAGPVHTIGSFIDLSAGITILNDKTPPYTTVFWVISPTQILIIRFIGAGNCWLNSPKYQTLSFHRHQRSCQPKCLTKPSSIHRLLWLKFTADIKVVSVAKLFFPQATINHISLVTFALSVLL